MPINSLPRITQQFESFDTGRGTSQPTWVRNYRKDAFAGFRATGFPTARKNNELWKYTNVSPIASTEYKFPATEANKILETENYDLPCPRVYQIVFVDGKYAPLLSSQPSRNVTDEAGVITAYAEHPIVGRLADGIENQNPLVKKSLGQPSSMEMKHFVALNASFLDDGAFVYIPNNTHVAEPIYLLFISTGTGETASYPRTLVITGENSSATVLQSFEGLGDQSYFTNAVTEVIAGQNSYLSLYNFQRENNLSSHVSSTYIEQYRGSQVDSISIDIGGHLTRRDIKSKLLEPDSKIKLYGLYYGSANQHIDNHTYVEHMVPYTSSEEVYKGILAQNSTGVFVGDVYVHPKAQKITANQINKNILLSQSSKVYTQPKLQIFADDVVCTHGAAVGQLDLDAIFYMKSRGINELLAKQLLLKGFTSDILQAVIHDALRQYLEQATLNALGEEIYV
jgi:Fe-S cluster assembly protein SufD